eukprot:s554_g4.t1
MPLQLRANQTHLVVCGLSGKRYSGVAELYELLKPLLPEGVVLIPRDGLCSTEALNRYVRWAQAAFFIRVEASDAVREANGWRSQFGPDDLVRDDHWTELALDEWNGWDAVIHNDGDSSTLCAEARRLAACVAELRRKPELSRHIALPEGEVKRTEFTTVMPECMRLGGAEAYVPSQVTECPKLVLREGIKVQPFSSHSEVPPPVSGAVARTEPVPEHPEVLAAAEENENSETGEWERARQARVEPMQPAPCEAFEPSWSWGYSSWTWSRGWDDWRWRSSQDWDYWNWTEAGKNWGARRFERSD